MIPNRSALKISCSALVAAFSFAAVAHAGVVYENSSNYLGYFSDFGNSIVGDEVILSGSDRVVTDFKFEYFLSLNTSGNEFGRLQFYANDGSGGKPGSLLYDSGLFGLLNGMHTVTVAGLGGAGVKVDNSFTWAVEFSGLEGSEQAGLPFYDPPTIGSSFDDFWVKKGADWQLFSIPGLKDNFAAQITATTLAAPIPETGALLPGLAFAVGAVTLTLRRRHAAKA